MDFATYETGDGGVQMITVDEAFRELCELGHTFAVALAELGHDVPHGDLMNGLAAYATCELSGESARLDAAHSLILKRVTDIAFEIARDTAGA